ncbi:MAG: YggT family protein [Chloroflexi bacterium]|nr:YggT family protein [Chloroflexota bacterium]
MDWIIGFLMDLTYVVVLVYIISSFVVQPWHPFRLALDRLLQPVLTPIRRALPQTGGLDFSPFVLLLLVRLIGGLLIYLV